MVSSVSLIFVAPHQFEVLAYTDFLFKHLCVNCVCSRTIIAVSPNKLTFWEINKEELLGGLIQYACICTKLRLVSKLELTYLDNRKLFLNYVLIKSLLLTNLG